MTAKPSCILSADWHIRSTIPQCRIDKENFIFEMKRKVMFVVDLAKKYECPILVAGDVGDKHEWPNWLLTWFIKILSDVEIIAIPGQHDLPDDSLEELDRSGMGVVSASDTIDVRKKTFVTIENDFNLISFPYSQPIRKFKINRERGNYRKIAMTHQLIVKKKQIDPKAKDPKAITLLKKYSKYYDLILSGDNHMPFVSKYKGSLLVNPGSLMRTTAAQARHRPRVYLWYSKTNTVERILIPIKKGVISREHIQDKEEQERRMEAYVIKQKEDVELSLSFKDNLRKRIKVDKVKKLVKKRIWEMVN